MSLTRSYSSTLHLSSTALNNPAPVRISGSTQDRSSMARLRAALLLLLGVLAVAQLGQARKLFDSSGATAISVAGSSVPGLNCGFTSTQGDAQAFASGPPCAGPPALPPAVGCPATNITIDWQLPLPGAGYKPLALCPGGQRNTSYGYLGHRHRTLEAR